MTQFTDAELDAARNRWDLVAADVPMKRKGRELAGCCPFHAERTPSFYVSPDKGFFHCFGCGAHGNAIDYVMRARGLEFIEAVREMLGMPAQSPRAMPAPSPRERRDHAGNHQEEITAILSGCWPCTTATGAGMYLWSRGLPLPQRELLAHPALYCHEIRKPLPALIAPLTTAEGEIVAIQRIWVVERLEFSDGVGPKDSRAPLEVRKKTLGHMGAAAVRLREPRHRLGLAEGVETAIAADDIYKIPVWATCGASRLGHIEIPPGVEEVVIFGDNGANGVELAMRAVDSYERQGFAAEAIFPKPEFGDFNDQLQAEQAVPA